MDKQHGVEQEAWQQPVRAVQQPGHQDGGEPQDTLLLCGGDTRQAAKAQGHKIHRGKVGQTCLAKVMATGTRARANAFIEAYSLLYCQC